MVLQERDWIKPSDMKVAPTRDGSVWPPERRKISIAVIREMVCQHFDISQAMMLSQSRADTVSHPRMLAMFLSLIHSKQSTTVIARAFNKKNHTTVLHAAKRWAELMQEREEYRAAFNTITAQIEAEYGKPEERAA